jgi:hypothetical protein
MFYKFLKFLFLSTLTLVWGGCESKDHAVAGYGCISTQCYNTTATDKNGMTISIIECEDGTKYLKNPGLYIEDPKRQETLPDDVQIVAPNTDECGATNCKYDSVRVCIDAITVDEQGNEHGIGACHANIECPEK